MSSAELSIEISRIVSRAMCGEPIDVAAHSEELATRFSDLGMSAELIGKAIARAAGMVGVALEGAGEEDLLPAAPLAAATQDQPGGNANGFHANATAVNVPAGAGEAEAAALRRVFLGESTRSLRAALLN